SPHFSAVVKFLKQTGIAPTPVMDELSKHEIRALVFTHPNHPRHYVVLTEPEAETARSFLRVPPDRNPDATKQLTQIGAWATAAPEVAGETFPELIANLSQALKK